MSDSHVHPALTRVCCSWHGSFCGLRLGGSTVKPGLQEMMRFIFPSFVGLPREKWPRNHAHLRRSVSVPNVVKLLTGPCWYVYPSHLVSQFSDFLGRSPRSLLSCHKPPINWPSILDDRGSFILPEKWNKIAELVFEVQPCFTDFLRLEVWPVPTVYYLLSSRFLLLSLKVDILLYAILSTPQFFPKNPKVYFAPHSRFS